MTRLNPAFTSLKTLNITYQTPQETLLATPEILPTSEPTTPQIGYTVADAHLPTFNVQPYKKVCVAMVLGAGKVITAGTLYWRMKKNGASVANGSSSIAANNYYTVNAFFYDVNVGNVLELALWSSVSDSNWDYKAFAVLVTRIIRFNKPCLLMPCNFSLTTQPVLTVGNPSFSYEALYPYHLDKALPSITADTSYEVLFPKDTFGLFRINRGDYQTSNSAIVRVSGTSRPSYFRNYVPAQIIMRGVRGV